MRARKKLKPKKAWQEQPYWWGAYWHKLTNTTEPSVCGGDAAFWQITLTTCYYSIHSVSYKWKVTNLATCGIQMSSQRQKQQCHQHQETAVHCRAAVFHSTLTHLINRLQPLHTAHSHTQETATFSWCVIGFLSGIFNCRYDCEVIVHHYAKFRGNQSNRSWDMAIFRYFQNGDRRPSWICYQQV